MDSAYRSRAAADDGGSCRAYPGSSRRSLVVGENLAALVETIERDHDMMIENVAVDPSFQKRGYGRKMVAYAEQLARGAGLTTVRL